MLSLLTGLLTSLSLVSPADASVCACAESIYPELVDRLCKTCGNPKPPVAQNKTTTTTPVASPVRPKPPLSRVKSPRTQARSRASKSEPDAVRFLNKQLTVSLSNIANDPVLICSRGPLAVFENGKCLHEYQAVDLQRMRARELEGKGTILAYDMGLGKTVTTIALICIQSAGPLAPGVFPTTAVIAPNIGVLQHWQGEFQKFAPRLKVLLYHGEGKKKDPRLPAVVLLTLWEVRNQWAAYVDENVTDESKFPLFTGTFRRIVIDEAQVIRNPESASAKACWGLKKLHGLCLSGTPAQNKLQDLQPLLQFLDVQLEGLNNLTTFNSRVTIPYKQGDIVKATELLVRVLSDCMIYRPKQSGLGGIQLPKRHDDVVVRVQLTSEEREVYRYIQSVHPFNSAWAKTIRLRQAADHPALLTKALHRGDVGPKPDDTSDQMRMLLDETHADANEVIEQDIPLATLHPILQAYSDLFKSSYVSSKFRAIREILGTVPRGEKTVIFSHFLTNLDILAEMLSKQNVSYARYDGRMGPSERTEALDQIHNDHNCTVLLMSIMAGGTGLDIPSCNHVILVEPWWNPYVEDQAISRVHRIGQVREVKTYKLLVQNSIEDSIVKTQDAKREVIGGLLSLCTVPDVDEMRKWLA
ncbi:P-loop containing nucleoside triphosphate hydrolase protein [Mycena alexandri]|uniref:P-loop containing nucleoside triphosphate hydrolase protein n=1 Tax=Mycena alexandri TaxID=1745969 RepID=A0AAD6TLS7_9AGAR|nr:P-loop containing nucleoside triphosphate hydrolase protein [Mycena alexandri]